MGKKKDKKMSWTDWCFWYCTILAIFFTGIAAIPPIPWRYARVDTNVGNRFVSDRRYGLFGASNQFGQTQMWFSLRTKMQRKTEEFGRPSPLTAIVGVAGTAMGAGGAAMGCIMWIACKEHVASRYIQYGTIAISGIVSFLGLGLAALCSLGSLALMQFEGGKKKKKKKSDDELEPVTKTMLAAMIAWALVVISVLSFFGMLDMMLKSFKTQAYYPYAASYLGFFIAAFATCLHNCVVCCAINRKYHCCTRSKKKKKDDEEDWDDWGGDYGAGYGKGKW